MNDCYAFFDVNDEDISKVNKHLRLDHTIEDDGFEETDEIWSVSAYGNKFTIDLRLVKGDMNYFLEYRIYTDATGMECLADGVLTVDDIGEVNCAVQVHDTCYHMTVREPMVSLRNNKTNEIVYLDYNEIVSLVNSEFEDKMISFYSDQWKEALDFYQKNPNKKFDYSLVGA